MTISWDAIHPVFVAVASLSTIGVCAVVLVDRKNWTVMHTALVLCLLVLWGTTIFSAIGPWKEMVSGVYDHVEYSNTHKITSHGSTHIIYKTIIFFSDGRTTVLEGEYSITFKKGEKIHILTKNNFYKIEQLNE